MNANPEREERPETERVRVEQWLAPGPQLEAASLEEWFEAAEACLLHSMVWHFRPSPPCGEELCVHDDLELFIDVLVMQQLSGSVATLDVEEEKQREVCDRLLTAVRGIQRASREIKALRKVIERDGVSSNLLWMKIIDRIISSINGRKESEAATRRSAPQGPTPRKRGKHDIGHEDVPDLGHEVDSGNGDGDDAADVEEVPSSSGAIGGAAAAELLTPCFEVLAECARRLLRRIDPWADPSEYQSLRWYSLDTRKGLTTDKQPEILQRASAQMTLVRLVSADRWRDMMTADPDHLWTRLWRGLSQGPVYEAVTRLDPLITDDPSSSRNPLEQQRRRTTCTVSVLLLQELRRMAETDDDQPECAPQLVEVFDRMVTMNVSKSRGKQ